MLSVGLTWVLDFLALDLSGSSVSDTAFSRCLLEFLRGEDTSSFIFCHKGSRTQQLVLQMQKWVECRPASPNLTQIKEQQNSGVDSQYLITHQTSRKKAKSIKHSSHERIFQSWAGPNPSGTQSWSTGPGHPSNRDQHQLLTGARWNFCRRQDKPPSATHKSCSTLDILRGVFLDPLKYRANSE